MSMVEFTRYESAAETGEDDGLPTESFILIRPSHVAAVFSSQDDPQHKTVIRFGDGRGFAVRHSYAEVKARLNMQGAGNEALGGSFMPPRLS